MSQPDERGVACADLRHTGGQRSHAIRSSLVLVAAVALMLAGCVEERRSIAGDPSVRSLAAQTGLRTEIGQPKEFVVRTRPSSVAFVPVEVRPPDRAVPRRLATTLPGVEQDLDASRRRSAGFAQRSLPKSKYGGVDDARRSVARARAQANRPIVGEQPTSYPVPEARRTNRTRPSSPLGIPE